MTKDVWDMALRANIASGLGDRRFRMAAIAFAEDCLDFYFHLVMDEFNASQGNR